MDKNLFRVVRKATRIDYNLDLAIAIENDNLLQPIIEPKHIASDHDFLQISFLYDNFISAKGKLSESSCL